MLTNLTYLYFMKKWLLVLLSSFLFACSEPDLRYETEFITPQLSKEGKLNERIQVNLQEKHFSSPMGLKVHAFGAFEVYWDGISVGKNGVPASAQEKEIPGTETSYYQIPDALAGIGHHTVTLKGTQIYKKDAFRTITAKPENYLRMLRQPLINLSLVNLMAGAFLIAALYYAFLYLNSQIKKTTTLLFATISFLFFALLTMEYAKFAIDIPYTLFYTRLAVVGWLTFAIAILIPLYFAIHFKLPHIKVLLALLLLVLLAIYFICYGQYDLTAYLYGVTWWISATLVSVYALFLRKKGSLLVCSGLILALIISRNLYYDFSLYIAFTIILICILYLQTTAARELEHEHQQSTLLSSRLQLELVKKNIQPHFLRNTLTSLIDWVEETPAEGVKMIKALSAEFDLMMDMAEETLVPIDQEIALCKRHLEVMQFRKEISYIWEDHGIKSTEFIPPALLLTLVENGITHSLPTGNVLKFTLRFEQDGSKKEYILDCLGQGRQKHKASRGNGFSYVKARLRESYGTNWHFDAYPFEGGWRNIIRITL